MKFSSRPVQVLLVVLALLCGACFGDGADSITAQVDGDEPAGGHGYPDWLHKVYPPPGSETSVTQALQAQYTVQGAARQVRLILDGTDVTTYATATAPGLLEYDMDQASAPVELDPGEHNAVVELYKVEPGSGEGVESFDPEVHEAIDSFAWSFTVL